MRPHAVSLPRCAHRTGRPNTRREHGERHVGAEPQAARRRSAASEAEQLWSARDAGKLVGTDEFEAERRLDAELGYGVSGPDGWGTLTPYPDFANSA